MEKLALASAKPVLGLGYPWTAAGSSLPLPLKRHSAIPKSRATVRASSSSSSSRRVSIDAKEKLRAEIFASVSSASGSSRETSSVGVNPNLAVPSSSSSFGSPLFWIGVGVGLSAFFSWLASYLKKYAMQQAMKTMMGQMAPQNSQFGASNFSTGSPFSYTPPSATGPSASPGLPFPFPPPPATGPYASPVTPKPTTSATATVDVSATNVEATPPATNVKTEEDVKPEPKRIAFEDVSPDEALPKSPFEKYEDSSSSSSSSTTMSKDVNVPEMMSGNGAATTESADGGASNDSNSTRSAGPIMSVEALEKMMEDPTVQQMVYPYLPEEMRNPSTFKWMLQNPEYRKQLQDMLNNMGGNAAWDNRMMDTMKNFDLSSPEVKQQFDQIGLTPEEVISKIMANPEVAMAFQNPRVQAAIMDCSQNPYNITKYQNDKEVMDVFNKISELFPGVAGSP